MRLKASTLRYVLCLYSCWLFLPAAYAQTNTRSVYIGAMLVNTSVKDDGMSALVYQGYLPGVILSADFEHRYLSQQISIGYQQGDLGNRVNATNVHSKTVTANYTALWRVINVGGVELNGGLASDIFLATRNHSQFINNHNFFEFVGSAALAIQAQYSIGQNKPFDIETGVTSSLVSAISRSNFEGNSVNNVQKPAFSSYLDNLYAAGFKGFTAINWLTLLQKPIDNKSKLGIGYRWNYYHLKQSSEVSSASHMFIIHYTIRL